MNAKRGYVPEDERNFSRASLETMRMASRHIDYLINEGYDLKQASVFVGNHFILFQSDIYPQYSCVIHQRTGQNE